MKTVAPYGTWTSKITAKFLAEQSMRTSAPKTVGPETYWLESRPQEQGRQVIMRRTAEGKIREILPPPWSARSRVHEYGGGAYTVTNSDLYFVNAEDQQIYHLALNSREPKAITKAVNTRFADLQVSADGRKLVAVAEQHHADLDIEPENFLIVIDLNQTLNAAINRSPLPLKFDRLVSGNDFYSNPSFSPCGNYLAYISWNHPNMPWDNSELSLLTLATMESRHIAGDGNESVVQPRWSPSGDLLWVSDKSNWWNIYELSFHELNKPEKAVNIFSEQAEFATPPWVFGMSSYCFTGEDTMIACSSKNGKWRLHSLQKSAGQWQNKVVETPFCYFGELNGTVHGTFNGTTNSTTGRAVLSAGSTSKPATLYTLESGNFSALNTSNFGNATEADISHPKMVTFPTGKNAKAHAAFYPPANANFSGPPESKPPLVVFGHGGPTGSFEASFQYKVQYWTQHGFAVLDVNYRGSTGYGREFRHSLQKQWGVYDVEDMASAVKFVTEQGWVHPEQRVIRGGSAGGFTVLAALTDTDVFNAGCTLYGVGDLETLAADTHKFEARYLDRLVGLYPEEKARYVARSPIHKVQQIRCPLLVFQGQEDKVVPPEQADTIVKAVREQGLPVAYVLYKNEGHGFRRAENIEHQARAELYFYQSILGLKDSHAESNPPINIENL